MKSKQTPGNVFIVFLLCIGGFLPIVLFIVRMLNTDFDSTLEYFCEFVDGIFND